MMLGWHLKVKISSCVLYQVKQEQDRLFSFTPFHIFIDLKERIIFDRNIIKASFGKCVFATLNRNVYSSDYIKPLKEYFPFFSCSISSVHLTVLLASSPSAFPITSNYFLCQSNNLESPQNGAFPGLRDCSCCKETIISLGKME